MSRPARGPRPGGGAARGAAAYPAALSAATICAAALLLLPGCTTRDRSNPLDPRNSHTGGTIPGFNALAGDSVVELRWVPLAQSGVRGYRIQRWKPGESPQLLGAVDYAPYVVVTEDHTVSNDSTYVYRLIAHFDTGDSAVSPPDSATPGARRIVALGADVITLAGFTPDLRDFLYTREGGDPFDDMDLDRRSETLWVLAEEVTGAVLRRFALNGVPLDEGILLSPSTDISVGGTRGIAWVALPNEGAVAGFAGGPSGPVEVNRIQVPGSPQVVRAGTLDASVWVGTQEGRVFRADPNAPSDRTIVGEWDFGAPIGPIAMDETEHAAWVMVRGDQEFHDLYRIAVADSTARLVRSGLDNVVDLETDARTGDLWVSERGVPHAGTGAVLRLTRAGSEELKLASLEPYGLEVDLNDGTCWLTELRSNRILRVAPNGALLQVSRTLSIPFAVKVLTQ